MHIKIIKMFFKSVIVLAFCGVAEVQADKGIIAYVGSSVENKDIHLINSDSTQDRVLWSIPTDAHVNDRIGALSWRPDGTELAFDSAHNWQRSIALRDIYAISPDGTKYRKVTNAPGSEGSNNFPTGNVKFTVDAFEQGDVQIYIQGTTEPTKYFARQSEDYTITQTVADWGDGVRQYIRLWDPGQSQSACGFGQEAWVDVIPGQDVDLGRIPFESYFPGHISGCYVFYNPSWSQDGKQLLFLKDTSTIKSISSHPEKMGDIGVDVRNSDATVKYPFTYRAIFAPTAEKKKEFLYVVKGDTFFSYIYHATTEDSDNNVEGAVKKNRLIGSNKIFDIAWLPDGSGFISSQYETGGSVPHGVIYKYKFSDKSLTEIVRVTKESIGKLTISPDGTSIVFERGQNAGLALVTENEGVKCPCSIWVVNMDGSGMRKLVDDGRAPAWGKTSLTTTEISPIDAFYNWAEREYPQYFSPHQNSQEILGYYARYYPEKNIYLGSKNSRVYVHGEPFGGLLDAGDLQGWLQKSGQ